MAATEIRIIKDNVSKTTKAMNDLIGKQVLVGFPDTSAGRKQGPINNATLGYIHEFGSPAANIPARPFLIPGVKSVQGACIRQLRMAAQAALEGDSRKADAYLGSAGTVASNAARDAIVHGNFVPLKPATIAARARGRGTKTRRRSEIDYLKFVAQGVAPAAAQAEVGIKALINTSQMLRAITYVLRKVK